jgi:hypothetical protein
MTIENASPQGRRSVMNAELKRPRRTRSGKAARAELAKFGAGEIAYIREMTSDQAKAMFPAIEGLPTGINLFALHGADGTPIALTDSRDAAIGHAIGDALEVRALH